MKHVINTIFFVAAASVSTLANAQRWTPDDIRFDLEGGTKIETMLWLSGYSYAITKMHERLGCINKEQNIASFYLVGVLNAEFNGKTITSEQASDILDKKISIDYECKL